MGSAYDVIVLPGILGTQLSYKGGAGGKTVAWCNVNTLLSGGPLSLALDIDGKSPYPIFGKTLFADGPVGLGVYEPLLTHLANNGFNPYFFGYDWRLDLETTAAAFVAALQKLPLASSFQVVAHSMGGLVARLAYPQWKALTSPPTWSASFYLCTPNGGSHWASMVLNGLYYDGSFFRQLGRIYDVLTFANPLAKVPYISLQTLLGITVGSWPATYQLLPSGLGQYGGLDPLATRALQFGEYDEGPGGVQQQWLTRAAAVQSDLNNLFNLPRPREMCFAGTGNATPIQFIQTGDPTTLSGYVNGYSGDGTVTKERVAINGALIDEFQGTTHNAMCNSFVPLDALVGYLKAFPAQGNDLTDIIIPAKGADIPPPPPKTFPALTWDTGFQNKTMDP